MAFCCPSKHLVVGVVHLPLTGQVTLPLLKIHELEYETMNSWLALCRRVFPSRSPFAKEEDIQSVFLVVLSYRYSYAITCEVCEQ